MDVEDMDHLYWSFKDGTTGICQPSAGKWTILYAFLEENEHHLVIKVLVYH